MGFLTYQRATLLSRVNFVAREFVYGAHFLALGAAALVIAASLTTKTNLHWSYPFLIYLIAYTAYLYDRLLGLDPDKLTNRQRVNHLKKYSHRIKPLLAALLFLMLFIITAYRHLYRPPLLAAIWAMYLGGILYGVYLKKLTRHILAFKNFFVALEYSLPIIILPLFPQFNLERPLVLLIVLSFLKVFIVTSYFDIKDVTTDRREHLRTLPVLMGIKNHLHFLRVLDLFWGLIMILALMLQWVPTATGWLLLTVPYDLYLFHKTEQQNELTANLYFLVGSQFLLWPFLLSATRLFF